MRAWKTGSAVSAAPVPRAQASASVAASGAETRPAPSQAESPRLAADSVIHSDQLRPIEASKSTQVPKPATARDESQRVASVVMVICSSWTV